MPDPARQAAPKADALAVYVHWPFCLSKCPYCDFNSHVRESVDAARWRQALLVELDHYAAATGPRRVTSIFFGGGTPSLMEPRLTGAIIDRVATHWSLAADAEITLEANPTSAEAAKFRAFRAAGVNRVSIGVQALDDAALAFLGRAHSQGEARAAVEMAQKIMPRSTFDLIYARPGQTAAAWRSELTEALSMATDHLSLYQLTIEKGTPFYGQQRDGAFAVPGEDDASALFALTQEMTARAGLPAYEISNHAGASAQSRHNLSYWRYQDYVGVGPGAHGRIPGTALTRTAQAGIGHAHTLLATRQIAQPENWLEAVETKGHGTVEQATLTPEEMAEEMLMMGLRLAEGIERAAFSARTGLSLEKFVKPGALAPLVDAGYLESDTRGLRATEKGRPVLNALLASLLS